MRPATGHVVFQRGMALIISLLILVSLTLLGLGAIQNTSLEERMAGNRRAENIALQGAEAGLRAAEAWLAGLSAMPVPVDGKPVGDQVWVAGAVEPAKIGPYKPIPTLEVGVGWWFQWSRLGFWDTDNSVAMDEPLYYFQAARDDKDDAMWTLVPRYVIEEDGYLRDHLVLGMQRDTVNQRVRYKITARGVDMGARSEVLLQSTYARRF
jgi:type IV pilus assembly protein PilX